MAFQAYTIVLLAALFTLGHYLNVEIQVPFLIATPSSTANSKKTYASPAFPSTGNISASTTINLNLVNALRNALQIDSGELSEELWFIRKQRQELREQREGAH
ncbi:hypothetical protein M407DRAFT_27894 [Tulasnella calospora MUT 4182]|uniref:Uncharacterized protein n=1 Tax=Tulasnella calospora MUT 4182 TaxID=1051891 RepID=A0A0C3QBM6_9AGAM|nr:hypothetical protein M407DRAFT_27894 [Tulasnella calospora MUT 4182]